MSTATLGAHDYGFYLVFSYIFTPKKIINAIYDAGAVVSDGGCGGCSCGGCGLSLAASSAVNARACDSGASCGGTSISAGGTDVSATCLRAANAYW